MKLHRAVFLLLSAALASPVAHSQDEKATGGSTSDSAKAFFGRWDLTLRAPDHDYPSWLELREENGQLKAEMVGRWGNARPLPSVELSNGQLRFVSPKEEEGSKADMVFEGTLSGKILSGKLNGPDGKTWQWTGRRALSLKRSGPPEWALPIPLFNGNDLTGWHCGPDSNSGVYLRGRYEVQIETDSASDPPSQRMGGVYGFLAPSPEPPRKPGEWQTYDITLIGRMISVVLNGQTIIDNKEIPGITGGALDSHEELPGPIYLQGSEKGRVMFRKIVITPASK
jgi:hypothetical protein